MAIETCENCRKLTQEQATILADRLRLANRVKELEAKADTGPGIGDDLQRAYSALDALALMAIGVSQKSEVGGIAWRGVAKMALDLHDELEIVAEAEALSGPEVTGE